MSFDGNSNKGSKSIVKKRGSVGSMIPFRLIDKKLIPKQEDLDSLFDGPDGIKDSPERLDPSEII